MIQFKNERLMKFYRLSDGTFIDSINTIYQAINPFLDNKMSLFEEYGSFKRDILLLDGQFKYI